MPNKSNMMLNFVVHKSVESKMAESCIEKYKTKRNKLT